MSLDRAILLPREFDKKEDSQPTEGTDMGALGVVRSATKNTVRSQESGGRAGDQAVEKH